MSGPRECATPAVRPSEKLSCGPWVFARGEPQPSRECNTTASQLLQSPPPAGQIFRYYLNSSVASSGFSVDVLTGVVSGQPSDTDWDHADGGPNNNTWRGEVLVCGGLQGGVCALAATATIPVELELISQPSWTGCDTRSSSSPTSLSPLPDLLVVGQEVRAEFGPCFGPGVIGCEVRGKVGGGG